MQIKHLIGRRKATFKTYYFGGFCKPGHKTMIIENVITNVRVGEHRNDDMSKSGFKLARHIADEHTTITGNRCVVKRILDSVDKFDGRDREHYSFDVVEIITDSPRTVNDGRFSS